MKPSEWIKDRMIHYYGRTDTVVSRQIQSILDYLDEQQSISMIFQDNILYQEIKGAIYSNIKYSPTPDDITRTTEAILAIIKMHFKKVGDKNA